jgi:hypothetical protein
MAVKKGATTPRLSDNRLRLIRAIAGYEDRSLADIFEELTSEYMERHNETLPLLRIPGFAEEFREAFEEIKTGGGKEVHDPES